MRHQCIAAINNFRGRLFVALSVAFPFPIHNVFQHLSQDNLESKHSLLLWGSRRSLFRTARTSLGDLFEATLDGSTLGTGPIVGQLGPRLGALGKDVVAIEALVIAGTAIVLGASKDVELCCACGGSGGCQRTG